MQNYTKSTNKIIKMQPTDYFGTFAMSALQQPHKKKTHKILMRFVWRIMIIKKIIVIKVILFCNIFATGSNKFTTNSVSWLATAAL